MVESQQHTFNHSRVVVVRTILSATLVLAASFNKVDLFVTLKHSKDELFMVLQR
jgi:hypothetical protein